MIVVLVVVAVVVVIVFVVVVVIAVLVVSNVEVPMNLLQRACSTSTISSTRLI